MLGVVGVFCVLVTHKGKTNTRYVSRTISSRLTFETRRLRLSLPVLHVARYIALSHYVVRYSRTGGLTWQGSFATGVSRPLSFQAAPGLAVSKLDSNGSGGEAATVQVSISLARLWFVGRRYVHVDTPLRAREKGKWKIRSFFRCRLLHGGNGFYAVVRDWDATWAPK
jgi:hypothetical protein